MTDLAHRLRQENTEYLQEKIRTNAYRADAAAIAAQILAERGSVIPTPESDEVVEEKVRLSMRLSTQAFFTVAVWFLVVFLFRPSAVKTILFALALLSTLAYLHSQKKK